MLSSYFQFGFLIDGFTAKDMKSCIT
jgi:hypothetical protein